MNNINCKEAEGLLVDFADDDLSARETLLVKTHLAECADCRRKVEALKKTLNLTSVIWDDISCDNELLQIPSLKPSEKKYNVFVRAAIAAGFIIAAGLIAIAYNSSQQDGNVLSGPGQKIVTASPASSTRETLEEIKRQLDDCSSAARLLAAADLLNKRTSLKETALRQYEYIVEMYPDTAAAGVAKLKLKP